MKAHNRIHIAGALEPLFGLAADIERWPDFLPHYRWVKVLFREGARTTAEMAARHKGLPVWWKSIQTVFPESRRIHYTHIGGITRGMEVDWTFALVDGVWQVNICHRFEPPWPILGPWVADRIIGKMFVEQIAQKTLEHLKMAVERKAVIPEVENPPLLPPLQKGGAGGFGPPFPRG